MGVRVLARTTSASLAVVEARLEALGARPGSRWRVQCAYLLPRAADSGLHEIFDVQSSECGGTRFLVVREREGAGLRVVRAGATIGAVLEATHTHVARTKVLLEGTEHACGDFVVRAGQLFLNGKLAGVVRRRRDRDRGRSLAPENCVLAPPLAQAVDIEYLPCPLAASAVRVARARRGERARRTAPRREPPRMRPPALATGERGANPRLCRAAAARGRARLLLVAERVLPRRARAARGLRARARGAAPRGADTSAARPRRRGWHVAVGGAVW